MIMSKQIKPFWNRRKYDSIHEPSPHHTVLCMKCGYMYTRKSSTSKVCPKCGLKYKGRKVSEFYVGKKKIYLGKDMESKGQLVVPNVIVVRESP